MMQHGGNTTCVEVSCGKEVLIIDAGTGIRKLGEELLRRRVSAINIFITHSHWDHIQGFPFFLPIYSSKTKINVLGCSNSYKRLKEILSHQMSQEYFPVSFADLKSTIKFYDTCHDSYDFKGFQLEFIETNHPVFTRGLKLISGNSSFVFITDNELHQENPKIPFSRFVEFCRGATCLVHDAQFSEREYKERRGWGHSTYEQVITLAKEAGVRNLGFTHHDPNRKDTDLRALERKYKDSCKNKGCTFRLFAVREMDEFVLP